jgi:DNA-binding PadR family transcriptional regulator
MSTNEIAPGRLSQPALLVLANLEDGPQDVLMLRDTIIRNDDIELLPGTLCTALDHLERHNCIQALPSGEPHRPYRLTHHGEKLLQRQRTTMRQHHERIGLAARPGMFKERTMRPITWLLRLYPRAWRDRYETEMLTLLEQHHITLATIVDLLLGALDAHLDPYYRSESPLFSFNNKRSIAVIFICALAVSIYATFSWVLLRMPLMFSPLDTVISYSDLNPVEPMAMQAIIIVSCLSILFNTLRKDIAARRKARLIFTITSLAIPIFLLTLFDLPFSVPSVIGYLLSLELLAGTLCITIMKIREAIVTRQKGLLLLTLYISLLMPLSLFLFMAYLHHWPLTLSAFVYQPMIDYLIPFTSLGTLLLTVAKGEMNKKRFSPLLVPAGILTLIMAMNLIHSVSWAIAHGILANLWDFDLTPFAFGTQYNGALVVTSQIQGSDWVLFTPILGNFSAPWNNSIFICTAVMAFALGTALIAFLRGLGTLATLSQRSKEARPVQTQ